MLGVLVVVLCPNHVADLGFSAGERQISLIVSLRVLRALWGGHRVPSAPSRFERAPNDAAGLGRRTLGIVIGPFCMAHSLVMAVEYALCNWTKIREGRVYANLALVRPAQFAEGKMSPTERSRLLELIGSVAAITRCIYEPIVHDLAIDAICADS